MKGILNILKPPRMTSHDVVSLVRRKIGIKKVGHTGTLDPNAAGVLPICIGQATKISQFLLDADKTYRAELTLGITTDTQDIYGKVLNKKDVNLSNNEIIESIMKFVGEYSQIPPMYSAVKVKGKKLYELAREGIQIDRQARKVKIHSIDIISICGNKILFDVNCSKGTYIRTLCHDIGEDLNCGGIMSFLLRTKTSGFDIQSAITIEELDEIDDIQSILKPIDFPLMHMPKIDIEPKYKKAALNGNKIPIEYLPSHLSIGETLRIYLEKKFIGIGQINYDDKNRFYIRFTRLLV